MKRFARGALTLAFWVAVWTALALLVNRELLLPAPWVVVRRLCELAATAAFWRITAVSIGRVLLGITAAVALGTGMAVACSVSKTVVHHFIIYRMVEKFNLDNITMGQNYLLFACCIVVIAVFSYLLLHVNDKVVQLLKKEAK